MRRRVLGDYRPRSPAPGANLRPRGDPHPPSAGQGTEQMQDAARNSLKMRAFLDQRRDGHIGFGAPPWL